MENKYYNEQKVNYIKEKLSLTTIDKVYHPLIMEIMLRRQMEYNLDDKFFYRDLNTFIDNVKTITVEELPKDRLGQLSLSEKTITIASSLFKKSRVDFEEVFEILAHETIHAMRLGRIENGEKRDRVFSNTLESEIIPTGEAFTECEADALIYNKKHIRNKQGINFRCTNGYQNITGYVDLIAATFRS